ncbi:MAG: alternative ribosome rescue aminoacyl-tRNA hydrolase ArfB [Thermodesulfobacteriota bacterium]|nr:alternative ribosome rescue aminoacyl-tRNA hydrolase ArfB [Thermodesulfobacteriota bacterium]
MTQPGIAITTRTVIPWDELSFTASRSSGPGGQHVNKTSTRITLLFDVAGSPSLTETQKALISRKLANRMNKQGVLRIVSQTTRSQQANKERAVARFAEILGNALRRAKPRKKTQVSPEARQRRLEAKKRRGQIKRGRARPSIQEEE